MLKVSLRYVVMLGLSLGMFSYFVGFTALFPTSYLWLRGDGLINLYGWLFYQNSRWDWPITKISELAFPVGVLNVQLDVIPWLSIVFKSLSNKPFQYLGWWFLSCFFLMQFFGERILRKLGYSFWESLFFSVLFVLTAPFLGRFDHAALSAHWIFLAIIYISMASFSNIKKSCAIGFLMVFCAGIHPYLFVIVAGIFALWSLLAQEIRWWARLVIIGGFVGLGFSVLKFMGYLSLNSKTGYGLGEYNLDLLSWINSLDRSAFVPSLRSHPGAYEGLCYLGLGVILSLLFGAFFGGKRKVSFSPIVGWALLVPTLLELCYSYLDKIRFGGNEILDLSFLLAPIEYLATSLRVSGRFVWPFFYLLMVWYFFKIRHWFDDKRMRNAILILVISVQFGEFSIMRRNEQSLSQDKFNQMTSFIRGSKLMDFQPSYVGYFEDGTSCYSQDDYSPEENGWILVAAAHEKLRVIGGFFARAQEEHKNLCGEVSKEADVVVYSKKTKPSSLPNEWQNCVELEKVLICRRNPS